MFIQVYQQKTYRRCSNCLVTHHMKMGLRYEQIFNILASSWNVISCRKDPVVLCWEASHNASSSTPLDIFQTMILLLTHCVFHQVLHICSCLLHLSWNQLCFSNLSQGCFSMLIINWLKNSSSTFRIIRCMGGSCTCITGIWNCPSIVSIKMICLVKYVYQICCLCCMAVFVLKLKGKSNS